jgi:hypothetical protein
MMHTMSELGLMSSGGKRNEDEERRMKMRKVLKSIGRDKGRVSEEGIARIARRVGFANDIDAEKLTAEEKERKMGNRTITVAGNAIIIEIDLKNQVPRRVQVSYSTQSKALESQGARAGQVLLTDLGAPNGIALNAKLDHFAANLERLARMDRLSAGGISCFEAISGLYASLERLYEQEKEIVRGLLKPETVDMERKVDMEVMCKKSGKPMVNANGRIGIELAYWEDSRHVTDTHRNSQNDTEMDIDGQGNDNDQGKSEGHDQVFKLRLEVESCLSSMYPPLRVSDAWLPDPLELPSVDAGEGIPWQDPSPTYASTTVVNGGGVANGELPDLRFIATLDPPIVIPSYIAMNIHTLLGNHALIPTAQQYAEMLLDPTSLPLGHEKTFTSSSKRSVLSYKDGEEITVQHYYKLENAKLDWGTRIEQLPFSHPRQLVELLPTLRQWACMGSHLNATFGKKPENNEQEAPSGFDSANGAVKHHSELDDLLMDVDTGSNDSIIVNIALASAPTPSLGIAFPTSSGGDVANINVVVQPNADITATDRESMFRNGESTKTEETRQQELRLAKALDACGDLGVWVEWIRTQSSS